MTSMYPQLIEALRLLAAPPDIQRASLPDWVAVPDEVALAFTETYTAVEPVEIPERARPALAQIYSRLSELPIASLRRESWDSASLDGPPWDEFRSMARDALSLIGVPLTAPSLDDVAYVRSGLPAPLKSVRGALRRAAKRIGRP